jgi:hypothetical protein
MKIKNLLLDPFYCCYFDKNKYLIKFIPYPNMGINAQHFLHIFTSINSVIQ